jgi:hypothetical protein
MRMEVTVNVKFLNILYIYYSLYYDKAELFYFNFYISNIVIINYYK